jgi:putative nucleotidyltransferase with HDIG domain
MPVDNNSSLFISQGKDILILDADGRHGEHLANVLHEECLPQVAHNSREAIALIQKQPAALLLFAGDLPDMTQIEFIKFSLAYAPQAGRILMVDPDQQGFSGLVRSDRPGIELLPNNCPAWVTQQTVHRLLENRRLLAENAALTTQYRDLFKTTLSAMTDILEAKDPYTYGHSYRVSQYALAIARQLKLNQKDLEDLEIGGLLHDIGKIGIPESVLHKAGKLTEAEFSIVKAHPNRGYLMLWRLPGMGRALDVVRFHHERYDGQGYPEGSKGDNTPLLARILSVADSYDAMTSNRPYRPAMTHAKAVFEVEKNIGVQFDPNIAGVFLEMREMGEIRQVIEGAMDLPVFSPVIRQAMLLINNPDTDIRQLSHLISSDSGIAAKVLRLANSVHYGLPRKITDMSQALAYIGLDELFRMIVLLSAQPALNRDKGLNLWAHTIETAYFAEILAKRVRNIDPHEAFVAGLLHDMGKSLLLYYFPKAYGRAMELAQSGTPTQIAEVMVFGIDHAEIGAWLMEHWEMPTDLCHAVRYHHVGDLSNKPLAHLVSLANGLAHLLNGGGRNDLLNTELFDRFQLTPADIPGIQQEVIANTRALKSMILES